MEWYYVWWPYLTSKRVARVCQHQLSFLFIHYFYGISWYLCGLIQIKMNEWMKLTEFDFKISVLGSTYLLVVSCLFFSAILKRRYFDVLKNDSHKRENEIPESGLLPCTILFRPRHHRPRVLYRIFQILSSQVQLICEIQSDRIIVIPRLYVYPTGVVSGLYWAVSSTC